MCDLSFESRIGQAEIFPELCFVGVADGDDLVCYLSGETDCIPVDSREHPFEVFRDFFFSVQKYFSNADIGALLDVFEVSDDETSDRISLLRMMTEAETVYLSARCYFSLKRSEHEELLKWINTFLPDHPPLTFADIDSSQRMTAAGQVLERVVDMQKHELPLLALHILCAARNSAHGTFLVHETEEIWETPVLVGGEVVTASTEIGEFDTPMF